MYRKYRPATFAEVVGQEHVTDPLSTALDTGRISHAYLFSGPRGCGKTSSARILARSLNCVEGPTSRPCGVCPSCVSLGPGGPGNLDVIELDAASHGGVDDTRELRDRAFYAPAESRYRVFIVDEAHMVTTAGFNALLKIVEEPPAHLIFIFATTEPDKVLPTIRSRTHHYPFRLLPPATMRGLLGKICEQEGVQVEEAVYPLVIRAGGGSPRDSLSVLDQLLAGAGPDGVAYQRALALLGVTDIALIDEAVEALIAADGSALFGTVDRVVEAGHDPRRFATDLLERMRDLILLRAVPDAADRNLVTGPGDVLERMRDQAERIGPATLTRYAELLHEGLGEMRGATAPRLLLEVVCARMLLPSVSDAESAALQRLERLERGMAGGAVPQAPNPGQGAGSAPAPASAPSQPVAQPAGGSRRRGAEALAAIRAEKDGPSPSGATSAPAAPSAPPSADAGQPGDASRSPQPAEPEESAAGPDTAAGRVQEQRPHPAQRAQTPGGPENSDARPQPGADPASVGAADAGSASVDPSSSRSESGAPHGHSTAETVTAPADASAPVGATPDVGVVDDGGDNRVDATELGNAVEPPIHPQSGAADLPSAPSPTRAGESEGVAVSAQTGAPAAAAVSEQTGGPDGVAASAQDVAEEPAARPESGAVASNASEGAAAVGGAAEVEAPADEYAAPQGDSTPVRAVDESRQAATGDAAREIEAKWGEIRAKVREFGAAVHALLSGASVARVEGDTIVFAHQHAPLAQRLSNPKYVEAVQGAVHAVVGREYGVRWEVGSGAAPAAGGATGGAQAAGSGGRAGSGGGRGAGSGGHAPAPASNAGGAAHTEPPKYTRPSQSRATSPENSASAPAARGRESSSSAADSGTRSAPPDDDIPLPDGPDVPDDPGPADYSPVGYDGVPPASTPEEEQEMLAESVRPVPAEERRDPDEVALELLVSELGATRLEG
nr:DNA polymerase III subunit gamma and tau [Nocardia transvalensis]